MNWAFFSGGREPNNSGGSEHYGQIYSSGGGYWNDLANTSKLGYVVEYGGMSSYPVLSLAATRSIDMVFTYNITYNLNGGINYTDAPTTFTNASDEIVLGTPTKQGYIFDGWYTASTSGTKVTAIATGTTSNQVLYARWSAATNTPYKVEHYQQKVDQTGYVLKETDNKTGTTGATVTATAATYTGFTENQTAAGRVPSGTVAADGSLVLKLYYDRDDYTVTFNNYDNTTLGTDTVVFEGSALAPTSAPTRTATPLRAGHLHSAW
jgi:uncharacterized repeat protein (TIGR02543 family)